MPRVSDEDRIRARRVELTPELRTEFCERIADGETVAEIAADPHMPTERGIYLALGRDQAFATDYARAREGQLVRWEDELIRIADDASNDFMERQRQDGSAERVIDHDHISRSKIRIDTRKWLMSKRLPKRYGDRVSTEVSGPEGGPIPMETMSDRELAMRVAFLLTKGDRDAG